MTLEQAEVISVRGAEQWRALRHRHVAFEWHDGWDVVPYHYEGQVSSVVEEPEDYLVYVMFAEGGGINVGEIREYSVTVRNSSPAAGEAVK
jgi:hypothetical protein